MTDLIDKINKLRKEKNAVILAHNYQIGQIQDIADFTGDSLGLSIKAAATEAEVIVFCGVLFMAETAAILSPKKTVLLPDKEAGCPMADMISAEQLQEMKNKYPQAEVVCYVNSSAKVKALSDYCCTSSNAIEVVKSIEADKEIIFIPDKNLGQHVMENTNRKLLLWPGYCPTHAQPPAEDLKGIQAEHPGTITLAHPECNKELRLCANELLSTGQMLDYVCRSENNEFIIATEIGIIHTLQKQNPNKKFYSASRRFVCPNMKKITLEKVLFSLEDMKYKISIDEDIAEKAKVALERMVKVLPSGP